MKKIRQVFKRYFQTMPRHMKVLMAAILLFSLSILTMRAVIGKYVFTKATAGTFVAGATDIIPSVPPSLPRTPIS